MDWWVWLLAIWGALGTVAALWRGAAASLARRRERATRAHQLGGDDLEQDCTRGS